MLGGLLLLPWLIVAATLAWTSDGRAALASHGSRAAVRESLAEREMALAFIGLIFAGLALATAGGMDKENVQRAALLLVMALGATVIAWTATNLAGPAWTGMVVSAGLLFSVGALVLAATEVIGEAREVRTQVNLVTGLVYVTLMVFSIYLAWRSFSALTGPVQRDGSS